MKEARLSYCDICDETNNFSSRLRQIRSNSQKQKNEYGIDVKEYEFFNPDIDEVNYILNGTIKDCSNNYFHSFEYRCVFDNKHTKMKNS